MSLRSGRGEFYVGYAARAPSGVASFVRAVVTVLLAGGALAAVAFVMFEGPFAASDFEFGTVRAFEGRIEAGPAPRLVVPRPGAATDAAPASSWLMVRPGKHGAGDLAAAHDGRRVALRGTLVYRGARTMIEVLPDSVEAAPGGPAVGPGEAGGRALGRRTLDGEIVDSKCFLGVMNPGDLKTHRACATRCLAGGIPPLLVARDRGGRTAQLLLVGTRGQPIGRRVLDLVAEPVRVTGEVSRLGDLLVMATDPDTILRVEEAGR